MRVLRGKLMVEGRSVQLPSHVLRGMKMKNKDWSALTAVVAFLIGVILLWSFGRDWLKFESPIVILVGLIGVALPVLIVTIWKLSHRSPDD